MVNAGRVRRSFVVASLAALLVAPASPTIRGETPPPIAAEYRATPVDSASRTASARVASAPGALNLTCADAAKRVRGAFAVENNTWGKGSLAGWAQCVGIGDAGADGVAARWTWNWLDAGGEVKGYPAIVFGRKPGHATTTSLLPRRVSHIRSATVHWNVDFNGIGKGNLAFDVWLTRSATPATFDVPPITHEIMIWLDEYGGMSPGGSFLERVTLDGVAYDVYVSENWGRGWRYIAFKSLAPQTGRGRIDLVTFTSFLRQKRLIAGDEFVASIELGNEIISGTGDTRVNAYSVSIVGTSPN